MFISAGSPTRSLRAHPFGGSELLLVGGEGHHVGSTAAQPERYELLIEFARRHWHVQSIEHAFSSQDFSPDDHVPYAGRLHFRSRHVYVATSLNKWGITAGTAAAGVISDAVLGARDASDRRPGPRRGRDRLRRGQEGRRLPRGRRDAPCRVEPLHPPRMPGGLERSREDLGLSVPRLALRRRRIRAERAGGEAARTSRSWVDRPHGERSRSQRQNDKQYEGLKKKGMSKSRAAAIANSEGSSSRGGKKPGSGSSSKSNAGQGGTTQQKKAAGRKGGKATAKKS